MKFLKSLLCLVTFLAVFSVSVFAYAELNDNSARATLNGYFDALKNGDTESLSALMTPALQARHSALLSNEQYGDMLVTTYNDAVFTVETINETTIDNATASIQLQIGDSAIQHLTIGLTTSNGGNSYLIDQIGS